MAWCYEIRGLDNRLVETRSGFVTEEKALEAGQRAKRLIDRVGYSNLETLTLATKDDQSSPGASKMPAASENGTPLQGVASGSSTLKYPWQQAVLDAFLEPDPENAPRRINVAERAISARLLEADRFDLEERITLGEALLALQRLVREQSRSREEPADKNGIA